MNSKRHPTEVTESTLALIRAVIAGDLSAVKAALPSATINGADSTGQTPLLAAAIYGHREVAAYLIEQGADLTIGNDLGDPIRWFATMGWDDLVEVALERNIAAIHSGRSGNYDDAFCTAVRCDKIAPVRAIAARVDWSSVPRREYLSKALGKAISPEMVDVLVDLGADPNSVDDRQETPLFNIARAGKVDACLQLIARGADINHLSPETGSAVRCAAANNREQAMLALLNAGASAELAPPSGPSLVQVIPFSSSGIKQAFATWEARKAVAAVLARGRTQHSIGTSNG